MITRKLPAFLNSPGSDEINAAAISEAVSLLAAGDVVAIPTETVYGLAANALNPEAVAKIYEAKGRPATNPLIVHVDSIQQAAGLTQHWTEDAQLLAAAFWPGPLTLVLQKRDHVVPDITTGGGNSIAVRCPKHQVALTLIHECGFPLAAPSANRSNALSPTTAAHVAQSLAGRIPLILDGGPCLAGIESTVLDLTSETPRILRPGILSANLLSEVLGKQILAAKHEIDHHQSGGIALSPGQLPLHYSPTTPLYLAETDEIKEARQHLQEQFSKIVVIRIADNVHEDDVVMPADPAEYANQLYAKLHELDHQHLDVLLAELPPDTDAWAAITDRLTRAGKRMPR